MLGVSLQEYVVLWVGLAVIIVVSAVMGLISLFRGKGDKNDRHN